MSENKPNLTPIIVALITLFGVIASAIIAKIDIENIFSSVSSDSVDTTTDLSPIVFRSGQLTDNYDMGVDLSWQSQEQWVQSENDRICMSYPGGEDDDSYGSVFIIAQEPELGAAQDFSAYQFLAITLMSQQDNESVILNPRDEDTEEKDSDCN